MADAPAFQFYPSDWILGTLTFTPAEDGAYLRCVMHQWASGGVPADDRKALAGVMRVSEKDAAKLWATVSVKFERGDDGLWRNARVEAERAKQAEYRQSRIEAGRRGGLAKGKQSFSSATVSLQAKGKQTASETPSKPLAKPSSSSSSSSSSSNTPSKSDGEVRGSGALMMSAFDYEKSLRFNAYVGARLQVPHKLHRDFSALLGGDNPDAVLRAWYADIDAELERTKEPIAPTVWKFLEARFKVFMEGRVTADMWAAYDAKHGISGGTDGRA